MPDIAGILWVLKIKICALQADVGNSSMPNGRKIPTAWNGFESISPDTKQKKVQTPSSNGMSQQPFFIVFFFQLRKKCKKKIWGKTENVVVVLLRFPEKTCRDWKIVFPPQTDTRVGVCVDKNRHFNCKLDKKIFNETRSIQSET